MAMTEEYLRFQQLNCTSISNSLITRDQGQVYCEPEFDRLICWKAAPANSIMEEPCPIPGIQLPPHALAFKNCSSDGNWTKTDYNICFEHLPAEFTPHPTEMVDEYEKHIATVMSDIYFVFSILSLLFLLISIFIFIYFKSLHCHRITIHIHMFISFVIKFVILIIMVEPGVTKRTNTYKDYEWLCKTLIALREYGNTSNMYWMFVEGLYLHNQIAAAVFSTDAPFKLFCFIGWGLPGIIVLVWSIIMQLTYDKSCWNEYSQSDWIYLILVPFLLVIFINLLFLINIIRILVTKLRSNNTDESSRIKKTIRATIILFPLLGLTNIIFLYNPEDRGSLQVVYHITNAILQSTGGILLAVLYCFMNGEVKRVIRQKWNRFTIRRHLKGGRGRPRGSRASDCMFSQTEQTQLPTSSSTIAASSSSSDNTPGPLNNNRHNKFTTPIPEESIDDYYMETDPIVENFIEEKHNDKYSEIDPPPYNTLANLPTADELLDNKPVVQNHVTMNATVPKHFGTGNNFNNNIHIKMNGGMHLRGMEFKDLDVGARFKRFSGYGESMSAESFENLDESFI